MKRLSVLVCVLIVCGCAKKADDTHSTTPDTTVNPLAEYAGKWSVQAVGKDGKPLVGFEIDATDSVEGWKMVFTHLTEPVPGHHVTVQEDSVSVTVGPYSSALRSGVMVTTTSTLHVQGDEMSGRFTAVYEGSEPSVLRGSLKGMRK